jgi:hypothetical protein
MVPTVINIFEWMILMDSKGVDTQIFVMLVIFHFISLLSVIKSVILYAKNRSRENTYISQEKG